MINETKKDSWKILEKKEGSDIGGVPARCRTSDSHLTDKETVSQQQNILLKATQL